VASEVTDSLLSTPISNQYQKHPNIHLRRTLVYFCGPAPLVHRDTVRTSIPQHSLLSTLLPASC
jgi:hypothetical protein